MSNSCPVICYTKNSFHCRRLWHQLTLVLLELVQKPEVTKQLKEIYENVIADFEMK